MDQQEIAVFLRVFGFEHLDTIMHQLVMHTGVFDIPDPVHAELGATFAQEDRLDADTIDGRIPVWTVGRDGIIIGGKVCFTEVVEKSSDRK